MSNTTIVSRGKFLYKPNSK